MAVLVKTLNGLAYASVKTRNGLAVASAKTINGLDVTSGGGGSLTAITGQTLAFLRNDGGGYAVGFRFTVGAAPLTVTHLGRYKHSGDSANHALTLYNAALSVIAAATVDMSGTAEADGYVYVALGTPVVLTASTAYRLLSVETNGVDHFAEYSTTVVPSADITVNGDFYYGPSLDAGSTLSGNYSYGAVNFKYTL